MSDIKDIQKTNKLSAFFDVQNIRTTPFSKNTSGERAYARAERVVAALFLLTNHFGSTEQLRMSLRKSGTALLSLILSLRTGIRSSGADVVDSALAQIRELISLVRMSAISGYVSTQNAGEVIQALDDLGSLLILSQRSDLSEAVIITHEDLTPVYASKAEAQGQETSLPKRNNVERNTQVDKTDTQRTAPVKTEIQSTHNGRSQEILEILRFRGKLGIKDIYSNMPGCSEKMVQRELASLVSKGQVRKIGKKRWSTYELVQ